MSRMHVFIITIVLGCTFAARGTEKELSPQVLLSAWQENYGKIESMQVEYTEEIVSAELTENVQRNKLVGYIEAKRIEQGAKYHTLFTIAGEASGPKTLMESCYDGAETKLFTWGSGTVTSRKGLNGPVYETQNLLRKYMLMEPQGSNGMVPEFQMLLTNTGQFDYRIDPNTYRVAGQKCRKIEIRQKRKEHPERFNGYSIWVGTGCGMMPLKYEKYANGKLVEIVESEELAIAETGDAKICYPVRAHRIFFSGPMQVRYCFAVKEFVPNAAIEADAFTIKLSR